MTEPVPGAVSAGALLKAAREKQGLHIAALAAAIKVSPRKLEALEGDRHDELPDATFIRALAQTVCRTLKIESRPVLDLLPPAPSVALVPNRGGLNAPFRDRPGREDPGLRVAAARPLVWAAALLVVAAVAIYFVPGAWWARNLASTTAGPVVVPALPASAAEAALPVAPEASAATANAGAVVADLFPPAEGAASQAAASRATAEVVALAAAPVLPAASAPLAAPGAALVQLRSTQASWVEVRDARGQLLLSRMVQPGDDVGLDGSLPLRLTIGNAAATQLGFRGQPVDLASHTRDNVARVELQ